MDICYSGLSGSLRPEICAVVTKLPEKQSKSHRLLGSYSVEYQLLSVSPFKVWSYHKKLCLEKLTHEISRRATKCHEDGQFVSDGWSLTQLRTRLAVWWLNGVLAFAPSQSIMQIPTSPLIMFAFQGPNEIAQNQHNLRNNYECCNERKAAMSEM